MSKRKNKPILFDFFYCTGNSTYIFLIFIILPSVTRPWHFSFIAYNIVCKYTKKTRNLLLSRVFLSQIVFYRKKVFLNRLLLSRKLFVVLQAKM